MTFLLNIIISHILRIENESQGQDYTVSTYAVLGDKSIMTSAGLEPATLPFLGFIVILSFRNCITPRIIRVIIS